MELMEDAMMESEWRQLSCRNIVLEVLEDAVIASRWRLCRQVMEESVLEVCWETLEVSRIVKEVEDGGMERMGRVETQLRGLREDEEALIQAISEDATRNRRMEKTDRLKKAWKLSMEHKKCHSYIISSGYNTLNSIIKVNPFRHGEGVWG